MKEYVVASGIETDALMDVTVSKQCYSYTLKYKKHCKCRNR
jgi:hypothetical protein